VTFSPTAATSVELSNNRAAAALFKDSTACVCLPLPANPAKQKRPATTSTVDRRPAPADGRTATGKGARGTDATARGRPKTAATTTFYKPPGCL